MVFVRGADNRLWYRKCVGPWIEEWQSLGGHIAGRLDLDDIVIASQGWQTGQGNRCCDKKTLHGKLPRFINR